MLLEKAKRKRRTSSTNQNEQSSWSHLIFTILTETVSKGVRTAGKLNFLDLAGSENADAERNEEQKTEGSHIRTSLLTLHRIIMAKRSKSSASNVTFCRDSKLAQFLKENLQGKILMFLNINPEAAYLSESRNASNFAECVNSTLFGRSYANIKGTK
eukprot:TRINITY_DN27085_c0_g1_i3.p1 TRINITY_DN27085_c0_g1~~TRINITY_DN27085_c0_g1_i3.p1  ORF type:complete len:157 (+),score=31.05 TRINITY_DN27085_c0_g1_i3:289-759(+)